MSSLASLLDQITTAQQASGKPLAIILAGHNGSGKSTLWRTVLADRFRMPLVNADRMMLSILPEPQSDGRLIDWAVGLRDQDQRWMRVAQRGVQAFVSQAMIAQVQFAMETVFSHWRRREDGSHESKVDLILELQAAGYFVLLVFVGLARAELSVSRVLGRVAAGGHAVDEAVARRRFPRTQKAIRAALGVADAAILIDNSRDPKNAFAVCRVQIGSHEVYDVRRTGSGVHPQMAAWLPIVSPSS